MWQGMDKQLFCSILVLYRSLKMMPGSQHRAGIPVPLIMTNVSLEKLVKRGALWRGRQGVAAAESVEPTGWESQFMIMCRN